MKNKFVCLHGHFYQPPRENPWTDEVETEESASPDHDWNQRIFRECYKANLETPLHKDDPRAVKTLNNYENISFNFGPTLLSWMQRHHPGAYAQILTADMSSRARHAGHGNALAQGFNHAILPLASRRDKLTQIRWGLADFRSRFGREAEGLWLPETAVDEETLDCLAAEGLRFVLLAPRQAAEPERLDAMKAYRRGALAVLYYNDPLSRAVAFEGLLADGERFVRRMVESFADNDEPELLLLATDGESYGHHHRFGNMALAYAIDRLAEEGPGIQLTNPGRFLELFPPRAETRIAPRTSWSCAHGIERWKEDCGCSTGARPSWRQSWRKPLREALDGLAEQLDRGFEERAAPFFKDPWKARDAYIERCLEKDYRPDRFLAQEGAGRLSAPEAARALAWCELQRQRCLMFTSCGWFFDDISGLEAVQVLKYAARAADLARALGFPEGLEAAFLGKLEEAPSNDARFKNGAEVYRELVAPLRVDLRRAAAHFALSDHVDGACTPYPVFDARLSPAWRSAEPRSAGQGRLSVRHVQLRHRLTLDEFEASAAVLDRGGPSLVCRLRPGPAANAQRLAELARAAHAQGDPDGFARLLERETEAPSFGLEALFADDRRRALERLKDTEKATTW